MDIATTLGLTDDTKVGQTSSSPFESEGGLPTFDRIPFRVLAGKRPALNTFVVVLRHNDPTVAHYGRITLGSEFNRKATPGGMQSDDAYGMSRSDIRASEQSADLVRTMVVELLGELKVVAGGGFEVSEPQRLPHTGQAVHELPVAVIPTLLNTPPLGKKAPGLYLGEVESGGHTVPFLLPTKAVARHIAVLGKTGVGKSYAVGVLMEELHDKAIPMLTFDVLGDTEQTAKDLGGHHIVAGSAGFKIPYSILGLGEFLAFIPNLTSDQRELIAAAYGTIYDEALDMLDAGQPLNIPYARLIAEIRAIGTAINSKATDNAVRRAQAAFQRGGLLTDQPVTWPDLIAGSPLLNVYMGHLGQAQRNLMVGGAARILQRLRRQGHVPPFTLILDEAHLFLPGGMDPPPSTVVLREMIRTARHDAVGVVLLSQSPASMDKQILLTCNTRMLFALDPEDLRVVAGQLGDLPEESIQRIPRMARGTAVVTSAVDLMRHPVVVRIRERRKTTHVAETPDLSEATRRWRADKGIAPIGDEDEGEVQL